MNYLVFNPLADGGRGQESAEATRESLGPKLGGLELCNALQLNIPEFLKELKKDDHVIVTGGDGTLNHFVNLIGDKPLPCRFSFLRSGTGNDFYNDVKDKEDPETGLIPLNEFVDGLPYIDVNGKTYRFINGIGYGIDGECCAVAERQKKEGIKDINYGKISVGLLLKGYKAPTATLIVDGKEPLTFKKAYLASAMNGRYYGGGMLIAPKQKRGSGLLSSVVIHGKGRLGTLFLFPKIFKGTHVKKKKAVHIMTGKEIIVRFDAPCALQIDGEVIEGVSEYRAYLK